MFGARRCLQWRAVPIDIRYNKHLCDFNSAAGFASILAVVRRMRSGSLLMCAPVCSSWVWMSRSVTLRSRILPLGDVNQASVAAGNLQVSRLVLLLMLVAHWGGTWVVEQPMTSLMWMHPRFQALFRNMEVPCLTRL